MQPGRIFLLSPARCDGERAKLLLNRRADFPLAVRLREGAGKGTVAEAGAPLGEVFSFLSGLYFRGKLAYARAFAKSGGSIRIITTDRGLMVPEDPVLIEDLEAFARIDIASACESYQTPLRRDLAALAPSLDEHALVVLLGSIASGKYVDPLLDAFGSRLVFPREFVGRGDMSRGGLLLRHARAGEELDYIAVGGAVRRGKRPPKLGPVR